jgi:uncharacterized protein YuzE
MAITLAGINFNYHDYDPRGDTLFISIDGPLEKLHDARETPEGHIAEYDANGALIAIEFLNARRLLERDGELRVTLPEMPAAASRDELKPVLA